MKVDIYTHVLPSRYKDALYKYSNKFETEKKCMERRITLTNHKKESDRLNNYEDMVQILSATLPPLEDIVDPKEAAELARIANDEMAEMVAKNPKKYIAAIANLPLNNMDAATKETERAIKELGFKGIQIYTSVQEKPLSSEELMPLYKMMADFDLPIWIHPLRRSYRLQITQAESSSITRYSPYSDGLMKQLMAMTRLVFAGIFEKFPTIKFITHHWGGMIPYYAGRIVVHYNNGLERLGARVFSRVLKNIPLTISGCSIMIRL